jgi:aminomethyltransferase
MLPAVEAVALWQSLIGRGVTAAGLGARDTLRLEAGLNLYGSDMDESRHPLESGLAWTVAFAPEDRDFIGRGALERARAEGCDQLVGLVLEERGMLRSHQAVIGAPAEGSPAAAAVIGEVTSGSFSPTLNRAIALARVRSNVAPGVMVDIRGKPHAARIVKPPFVRDGKATIEL